MLFPTVLSFFLSCLAISSSSTKQSSESFRKLRESVINSSFSEYRILKTVTETVIKAGYSMQYINYALCDLGQSIKVFSVYPNWTCNSATTSEMICMWKGVHCQAGVVVELDLSFLSLTGAIPVSIGHLPYLTRLDLSSNSLSSSIPATIGMLSSLQLLILTRNKLTYSIPGSIGQLTSLQYLDLSGNELISSIPECIGYLTNLQRLSLNMNKLSSSIPSSIGKLIQLNGLFLDGCQLSSNIPESIGNLHNLENLVISTNKFTSSIPTTIGYLTNLRYINLGTNELSSSLPESIWGLPKLVNLLLSVNKFTSSIPSTIGKLTQLAELHIGRNKLSSYIPESIGRLTKLSTIDLERNKLTSYIPTSIGNLTNIHFLYLSYNNLTGSIPTSIGNLKRMVVFVVQNNLLSSTIPSTICSCDLLFGITLNNNRFSGPIPHCFGLLTQLETIILSHNSLTSVIPSTLGSLANLLSLHLLDNRLNSTVPSSLSQLSSVQIIDLSNNLLTGEVDHRICQLPNMFALYLGNNRLSCQPVCQSDGMWVSNAAIARCPDGQDFALYDLEISLGVVTALNRVVYSSSMELSWPEGNALPSYVVLPLGDPSAFEYVVDGFIVLAAGEVLLCLDEACERVVKQFGSIAYSAYTDGILKFVVQFTVQHRCCFVVIRNRNPGYGAYYLTAKTRSRLAANWAFAHSSAGQITATRLCQGFWAGVTCEKGDVTALDLKGYALKGNIPTSIGLLTGLTSLDLSFNEITGSIVSTLGFLTRLDSLKLSGNQLKGTVPEQLSTLSSLYVLDLSYNLLSGSLPTVFALLSTLSFNFLDENRFEGEVPTELCETVRTKNVTLTLTNNPKLICYQEQCWSETNPPNRRFDNTLHICSPTKSPTSPPTPMPSLKQGLSSDTLNTTPIAIAVSIVGGCLFILLISLVLYAFVYRKFYSKKALENQERVAALVVLPIHSLLLKNRDDVTESEMLLCVRGHLPSAILVDYDGQTVFDIIFKQKSVIPISVAVVRELLLHYLPIGERASEATREIWSSAVQQDVDVVVEAVVSIIREHRANIAELVAVKDSLGRVCMDIASHRCKTAFHRILCLHERFMLKEGPPEHKSSTSVVVISKDSKGEIPVSMNLGDVVALKFMSSHDQFLNEINTRNEANLSSSFTMSILYAYDGDDYNKENISFRDDAVSKGFADYPYCIVMEAASFNLKQIIDQHFIAGNAWPLIKSMLYQLAACLFHLHDNEIVHGDVKPANVVQTQVKVKLIDFDGSARVGDYIGLKYLSCYMPPEMVIVGADGELVGRVVTDNPSYELLPAAPSFDMWGLGCIMYLLCTGSTLFPGSFDDSIVEENVLQDLYDWSDSMKARKLRIVSDRAARDLLSQLLSKDPAMRPSADRVLTHPFLTGLPPARQSEEKATWDVFISYRMESDEYHAEVLYEECVQRGLKVWLDSKCLQADQSWLVEFSHALVTSSIVVCIMSRGAINTRTNASYNLEQLLKESPCDNLLLEWRLALEVKNRGILEAIIPVMVGDIDSSGSGVYSNYITSGCGPTAVADVAVESIESSLRSCLVREGLGAPFDHNVTVKAIYEGVLSNQGTFIEGDLHVCVTAIAADIAAKRVRAHERSKQVYRKATVKDTTYAGAVSRAKSSALLQLREEVQDLKDKCLRAQEELQQLREENEQLKK